MKFQLLIFFFFLFSFVFSQSKKQQIEILNKKMDSLNQILRSERNSNFDKVNSLNNSIVNLENRISNLKIQITKHNDSIVELKKEFDKKNEVFLSKCWEVRILEDNIDEKLDSIEILKLELKGLILNEKELISPSSYSSNEYYNQTANFNLTQDQQFELWDKTDDYELLRLMGPEGCDATSLFKDSKGTLWLGTGSSGGVYKFDEVNRKWIEHNNGIGPVHISNILEIDNILVIEIDNGMYKYLKDSKWISVYDNQIGLIQSQIQNQINEKKNRLKDFETKNHNKLLNLNLNINYLNSIELIDEVIYILDKRGLFYYDKNNEQIMKFETKGLFATDIYQIIPDGSEKLYVWTNTYGLWEFSNSKWSKITELKYNFFNENNTKFQEFREINFKEFLDERLNQLEQRRFNLGENSNRLNYSFVINGYITYSQGKFLLSVHGQLFEFDHKRKEFIEKISLNTKTAINNSGINDEIIEIESDDLIKEALYDIDGSLVFTIGKFNETNDYPIRKTSKTYIPYKEIQINKHPALVLNTEGIVFGSSSGNNENQIIPLSLNQSTKTELNDAFLNSYSNSINSYYYENNMNGKFREMSLADGIIRVSDSYTANCGYDTVREYYLIEPLNSMNERYICFYDDKKGNLYLGTAGSGLLKLKYK